MYDKEVASTAADVTTGTSIPVSHFAQDSFVWFYVAPILIPLGVVENCISVLVLRRHAFKDMPSRWTLICLSIVDSFVLAIGLTRFWLVSTFGFHPNEISDLTCKSISLIVFITSQLSSCLVALVSFERWLAVYFPHSEYRATLNRFGTAFVFLIVIAINLHIPWTTVLKENEDFKQHNITATLHRDICVTMNAGMAVVVDVLDMMFLFFIPFCVIATCNIAIIVNLRNRRQRLINASFSGSHRKNAPKNEVVNGVGADGVETADDHESVRIEVAIRRRTPGEKRDARVMRMLLLVSTTFLICNLPFAIVHLVITSNEWNDAAAWNHLWLLCYVLVYTNNCLNFPIYIISQPKFRKEMLQMFCGARLYRRKSSTLSRMSRVSRTSNSLEKFTKEGNENLL